MINRSGTEVRATSKVVGPDHDSGRTINSPVEQGVGHASHVRCGSASRSTLSRPKHGGSSGSRARRGHLDLRVSPHGRERGRIRRRRHAHVANGRASKCLRPCRHGGCAVSAAALWQGEPPSDVAMASLPRCARPSTTAPARRQMLAPARPVVAASLCWTSIAAAADH